MKINKRLIRIIMCVLCILLILSNFSYALDTSKYEGMYDNSGETTSIAKVAGDVLGVVQVIGMCVAVIGLIVLGIKYMISSPEEKTTIKEKAVIYVTGAIVIFAASGLVGLIGNWAKTNVR